MKVMSNEKEVLNFLDIFKVATTNTIHELFYPSLRYTQLRLKQLYDAKLIKRDRDNFTSQYYYYIKKPTQTRHCLLLTDFYRELNKLAEIEIFEKEFAINEVRPDALIGYKFKNQSYVAFVEVELSNNPDIEKYERLFRSGKYKESLNVFPLIFYITNKKIPDTKLKIIQVNEDVKNLREVLV